MTTRATLCVHAQAQQQRWCCNNSSLTPKYHQQKHIPKTRQLCIALFSAETFQRATCDRLAKACTLSIFSLRIEIMFRSNDNGVLLIAFINRRYNILIGAVIKRHSNKWGMIGFKKLFASPSHN